jgi:hypothetical protein
VTASDTAALCARADTAEANLEHALAALKSVMRLVDRRSYMTAEQQQIVRDADAVLAGVGR